MADRLRDALRDTPGLVSAYLFGSTATGRDHADSDVDVAVLVDRTTHPTPADRFELRLTAIATLRRAAGREVDLVILNDAPPQLARRIMVEGERLLVLDSQQELAHLRVVRSRAADLEPFLRRTRAVKLQAIAR
jgi:predicted nucleotidyltransferase